MLAARLDYEASCRRLFELGLADTEIAPPVPDHRPRFDDEEPLGVSFFRTNIEGDLSGLTLPRTYFGRSEIKGTSFRDTDLRESTLCWNDFIDVDFSRTILISSDLRASLFERVSFGAADLESTDLRRSTFRDCLFDHAVMRGAILTRRQGQNLVLSDSQRAEVTWSGEDGDEPGGG
jgi:BTB/POZ domain-containing protein KCTD9